MNHPSLCKLWAAAVLLASILTTTPAQAQWRDEVKRSVALFGHRNWIVIVDSAYPAQTSPGIQTIVVKGNHTTLPEIVTIRPLDSRVGHRACLPLGKPRRSGGDRHGGLGCQIRDHDQPLLLGGCDSGVVLIKLTPVRQK